MGRRRRKLYRPVRRVLPKVFGCPRCGAISVRITLQHNDQKGDFYHIVCGNPSCKVNEKPLQEDIPRTEAAEVIDAYNRFVDDFNKKIIE
ncbi:MAG: hypothetical protein QXG05_05190 [Nitrososphaerota archaeon]